MPAPRSPSPAASCCCCSNSSRRRARSARTTNHDGAALGGSRLAPRHRPLRHHQQPALRPSHRLPHRAAVLDLCPAALRRLSLGRRRADLLRPPAGNARRRPGGAGAGADRHRRRRDGVGAAAGAGAASPQAARHARPRGAAAAAPMSGLLPFPVALPLAVAAVLLLVGRFLPWRLPDAIATLAALAVLAIDMAITIAAASAPLVYWFGNWAPRGTLVIGIGFVAGEADAAVAAFIALLFAATFVFAWGYFEDIRAFFHVLMLLFLAAMQGFCFTHDLFNLFVWFEVMSVTAFALTAYRLEASSLEGGLNFTVTNSIGSMLMLAGIGLLYLRAGALDFGALAESVTAAPHDPVVLGAFCALATALLIKGAMVPFQFWLADVHAVAPSPVSVIFSGAMVPLGLFGIAKLYWEIFAPAPAVGTVMQTLLLGMGAASAVIGGMLAYFIGHGLVKGALFMIAGVLLASLGGIDELGLRGRGRDIWPAGVALGIAGLLLGGAPLGLLDDGARSIDRAAS